MCRDVAAGACAGSCVVLITTPLDVIKVPLFLSLFSPHSHLKIIPQVRMQALALSPAPPSLLTFRPTAASPRWGWVGSSDVAVRVLNTSGIRALLSE